MPYRVLFAEDAERDIEDLYRFIASRDGAEAAERILTEIESTCAELEEFPVRGNVPKELAGIGISEYRELHHKPWRMIYRILATDVVVYCVVDDAVTCRRFWSEGCCADVRAARFLVVDYDGIPAGVAEWNRPASVNSSRRRRVYPGGILANISGYQHCGNLVQGPVTLVV
jgi:toxin ParE1/3/4